MRGRTLLIGGYVFLASLAAPALVIAESPTPSETAAPPTAPAPAPAPSATKEDPPKQSALDPAPAPPPATTPTTPEAPAIYSERAKGRRSSNAHAAASGSVTIVNFKFSPASITVGVGDTVTWTNNDSVKHNATGDGINTGDLSKGESGSHTFSKAGSYSYICTIHPSMKGTVVVSSSGGGGSSAGGTSSTGGLSESTAGSLPGAAGTSSSLPATGENVALLALVGAALLTLGVALRRRFA